jgi:putative hydroxymethylpyrimidine transport system substrate-binding protein
MRKAVLLLVVALAVCSTASAGGTRHVTLMLDWVQNPDHVGFFYARDAGLDAKAGLDVTIRAPSDPTTPLKLVAAGRADYAISYEQELFYAGAKKLPVVAVAAVVPRPLNSVMAIDPKIRRVADLKGKTIGVTGVPADDAALATVLSSAGLARADVKVVHVGYNLLPALLSHRVDAVLGVYRNVEGIELQQKGFHPTVIPLDRAGVPSYDELVLVASASRLRSDPAYAAATRSFVSSFAAGTAAARRNPAAALATLKKAKAGSASFLAKATPATLALLAGAPCLKPADWRSFGTWMHAHALLKQPVAATAVMTTRYLPAACGR